MAQFSGAVKLADLNDFIAPSQACVVTLSGKKVGELPSDEAFAVRCPCDSRTSLCSHAATSWASYHFLCYVYFLVYLLSGSCLACHQPRRAFSIRAWAGPYVQS